MRAVAEVVAATSPDATYALVSDPRDVRFLQQECRIHGSPEGTVSGAAEAPRLRLALEEMALGVTKGFLRLETPAPNSSESKVSCEYRVIVAEVLQELSADMKPRDNAAWTISPQRRARLRVFQDLWERGYVVTFGSKFGADFLIYKDDPKHSHAVALVVVKGYEEDFARVDVVSFCRVAKMVKKQLLFACVRDNDESDGVGGKEGDSKENGVEQVVANGVEYISLTHALLVSRQEDEE